MIMAQLYLGLRESRQVLFSNLEEAREYLRFKPLAAHQNMELFEMRPTGLRMIAGEVNEAGNDFVLYKR